MRIMFMGTPEFAAVNLRALIESGENIVCAVSQPNKPKNRGMKVVPTPVAQLAQDNSIPLYAPQTLKNEELTSVLEQYRPELIVVVAYGKLLPSYILDYPKYGCINIHASLLPKYRGAAPIQWSVINGDEITGVTSMYMAEGMDTGDMILKKEIAVLPSDTAGTMHDKLAELGAIVLMETVKSIKEGTAQAQPQNDKDATYAPMLKKEMGKIDWKRSASEIVNLIRGMNPWPGAYSYAGGKRFKVFSAEVCGGEGVPGQVLSVTDGLLVAAAEGSVKIDEIQPENKKRMKFADFVKGNRGIFEEGMNLEEVK